MTMWTKIIWDKLGRTDIKLYKSSVEHLTPLIMEWVRSAPREELLKTISDIGIPITKDVDYYDGGIHEFGDGEFKLMLHDSQILPVVIGMFLAFPCLMEDIDLIKKIAEHYHAKLIEEAKAKKNDN